MNTKWQLLLQNKLFLTLQHHTVKACTISYTSEWWGEWRWGALCESVCVADFLYQLTTRSARDRSLGCSAECESHPSARDETCGLVCKRTDCGAAVSGRHRRVRGKSRSGLCPERLILACCKINAPSSSGSPAVGKRRDLEDGISHASNCLNNRFEEAAWEIKSKDWP